MDKNPKSSAGAEHPGVLNAQIIRKKPDVLQDLCEVAGLQFCWDHGEVVGWPLDEVLLWWDESSFRKGRVGKRGRVTLYRESSWSAWEAAWGWMRS